MSTAESRNLISVKDYLAGELVATIKHEYVAGVVHAMVGATNAHNLIASNVLATLHGQLKGGRCRPYNSDTKIRIRFANHTRFYYPDVSVVCVSNPQQDTFQDMPAVIVEVASPSTRRIDEGEKCDSYLTIPTLFTYVLLEQNAAGAVVYQRGDQGFERLVYGDPNTVIPLADIEAELRFADVYDGVDFLIPPTDAE